MASRTDEFVVEAREHLSVIEESLLALEKNPTAADASSRFDRSYRSIHSIKGDAGFLGLTRIHELAHTIETFLSSAPRPLTGPMIETLLLARDRLAVMIDDPARSGQVEIGDLLSRLTGQDASEPFEYELSTQTGGISATVLENVQKRKITHGRLDFPKSDLGMRVPSGPVKWIGRASLHPQPPRQTTAQIWDLGKVDGGLAAWFRSRSVRGSLEFAPVDLRHAVPKAPIRLISESPLVSDSSHGSQVQELQVAETPFHAEEPAGSAVIAEDSLAKPASVEGEKSSTLRIQVELLDRLMTLVGELTLVRNQSLLAFAEEDGPQRTIIQRLNSVTSELQDATLRARMQPVGNLFNRFPRMVRDLARQLGKQVEIELLGREVDLDKTILEQLSDPLMHLIRNSVDHGIELPDERVAKGKPPVGKIVLSATHEDGQVLIQIRDDGKGIDPQTVKAKALALRLKTEAELDRMTPRELFNLILLPGFSTASKVTEVSGRGVGMDVVKTNIEQLEGTLNIDSVPGMGCSMILRLPLTLAIIPCLVVTVGAERFAVPQRDLEEVVCLHPQSPGRIEQAFETEVYRLRKKLLPIVRLSEVLKRSEPFSPEAKAEILAAHAQSEADSRIEYILVLKISGRRFGLIVDEVRGTQEIVVKPLHASMKRVGIFTGATIMGDGRVALITDAEGIVEHARLSFESAEEVETKVSTVRDAAQAHRVLLFEYGPQEQFALPLIQIRRIEMISPDRIERIGDHEFVTVEGVSTRILRLDQVINASPLEADHSQMSLILPKFVSQPLGVLVSRIVDTESLALDLQQHLDQDIGILGSAIVRDRMTLFLDMHKLSEKLFGIKSVSLQGTSSGRKQRLLLIDDTAFFREVVKRYLVSDGREITTAVHGQDGLAQLAKNPEFDLIVSDIEMPVMDGWDFAREVRRRGIKTPMLALTSLSGIQYETKAHECGYDSYEVKLDHDRLVRKVSTMLASQEVLR